MSVCLLLHLSFRRIQKYLYKGLHPQDVATPPPPVPPIARSQKLWGDSHLYYPTALLFPQSTVAPCLNGTRVWGMPKQLQTYAAFAQKSGTPEKTDIYLRPGDFTQVLLLYKRYLYTCVGIFILAAGFCPVLFKTGPHCAPCLAWNFRCRLDWP